MRHRCFFAGALWLVACSSGDDASDPRNGHDPGLDIELVSGHDVAPSHAAGENCMACHRARGNAPGRFTAAGTIFGTSLVATAVQLVGLDGEVVAELELDASGNFYTTEPLPIPEEAVVPRILGRDGAMIGVMPFPTVSAACNLCHAGSARLEFDAR